MLSIDYVNGDGNAVRYYKSHRDDPSIQTKSICIIDGDSSQKENEIGILRLPGSQPEREVFDNVLKYIDENIAKLAIACHLQIEDQNHLREVLIEVDNTNRDPHNIFIQIGDKLGFKPESIIRGAFLTFWIQYNQSFCENLCNNIRKAIDSIKD